MTVSTDFRGVLASEAMLNVGNNIYATLLGLIVAATVVLYNAALTSDFSLTRILLSLIAVGILGWYYVQDWYDLNLYAPLEEAFHPRQMGMYCASVIGLGLITTGASALTTGAPALRYDFTVLGVSGLYGFATVVARDKLLEKVVRSTGGMISTDCLVAHRWYWSGRVVAAIVSVIVVVASIYLSRSTGDPSKGWLSLAVPFVLPAYWLGLVALKYTRRNWIKAIVPHGQRAG